MNVLIVRVSSLGDVVHNMPMVADIVRHYPDAKIDWVVEEAYVDLVRLNPLVRHVIPFALRRWRKKWWTKKICSEMRDFVRCLKQDEYDLVFDTQGLLKTSCVMRMARLAAGGQRVGLANATEGSGYESLSRVFHTVSVPVGLRTHAVQRARWVAACALGYTIESGADFRLSAPAFLEVPVWFPRQPYVVFFHGTARASKRWPVAHWMEIARGLIQRGYRVVLPWGNEVEKKWAEQIAGADPMIQVLPKLSLLEAVQVATQAALVIGVDTGLTHVAAAYGRPTIELYCDSPRWKTEGNWSDQIVNLGDEGMSLEVAVVEQAIDNMRLS